MKRQFFQIFLVTIILITGVSSVAAQAAKVADRKIEVKIYLQKTLIYPNGAISEELEVVKRKVDANFPLRSALEKLFEPEITAEEKAEHIFSSTYGMKFEGVTLKNGTATVRFSQPPSETNYGSHGPFIFVEAIKQTVKQFPTVRRVKICAVGETLIDSQLEDTFPRCGRTK